MVKSNHAYYTITEQDALARMAPAGALSSPCAPGADPPAVSLISGSVLCQSPGVRTPSLLDTCYQVGILHPAPVVNTPASVHRPSPGARLFFQQDLVKSLRACGRGGEAESVSRCGEDFKVGKCQDCGAYPAFPTSCKHRLCPDCAARRGALLVSEHEGILKALRYPKMLTLTFLSVPHLSREYIRWARRCFTKLRHRKVFKGCWGGIYSFETTYNEVGWHQTKDGDWFYTEVAGWHLHIHAVLGSKWMAQEALSAEWAKISGASVVDIRAIRGRDKWDAIKEVIKYPAKAATFVSNPALVNEFLKATEGVSLAYGFGHMYRVKTKEHGHDALLCPVCGGSHIKWLGLVERDRVMRIPDGYLWLGAIRGPPEVCVG